MKRLSIKFWINLHPTINEDIKELKEYLKERKTTQATFFAISDYVRLSKENKRLQKKITELKVKLIKNGIF